MQIQFIEIEIASQVNNKVLRERVERAQSGRSLEFILLVDGAESAFISFEDWSDRSLGFIYEMYVLPIFRGQGLGSAMLLHCEKLALKLGCTHVQLEANAFDRTISKEQLFGWYSRKGYHSKPDEPNKLEKNIVM
ncbi:GNAT family N-acetyltransferase [Marinomonas polaris]|uniref:GNAT family N-acetyltransferase n=1 Tax=Marinomonas polaris TaxID=293552 RepID=UPI003519AA19